MKKTVSAGKKKASKFEVGQLRLSSLKRRKSKEWRKMNTAKETCETPSSVPTDT